MMARTHVLLGMNALWLLEMAPNVVNSQTIPILAAAAAFGALLPDLDAVESRLKSFSVIGIRPFVPFAESAHRVWGHRGFLHSPIALVVLGGLLLPIAIGVTWQVPLALWLGYATHLLADASTRTGIPGFQLSKRLFLLPKKLRISTGSQAEDMLLPILAAAIIFLLLKSLTSLFV